jgi:DNA-binding MarR family transcriptional regulator
MPKPDLTALAREIDSELRAIRELVRRPLELEFSRGHLTGPQQSAMAAILASAGGLSLKELSKQLGLAHSTTSGIVDRLEKAGMVERRVSETDRRFTKINGTEAVRKFVEETMPRVSISPLIEALRCATPSDREAIATGLRTLHAALEGRRGS